MKRFEEKLKQARSHLRHLRGSLNASDPGELALHLGAFLAASRSIPQYAFEGAKLAGKRDLYQALVEEEPLLAYFKKLRDNDVHVRPVRPARAPHQVVIRAFDGRDWQPAPLKVFDGARFAEAKLNVMTLDLPDWPFDFPPEVASACERYLDALERFLAKAVERGLLSATID